MQTDYEKKKEQLRKRTKAFASAAIKLYCSLAPLLREADELIAIFVTMSKNVKARLGESE
jgi:hypothetical protein